MAPNSPSTEQIDTLVWVVGSVAALIVIAAVNLALFYALRRYRSERGDQPRQVTGGGRIQFRVAGALTGFAVALFVLATVYTTEARETPVTGASGLETENDEALKIEATGQQWMWRYDYPNEAFSYYKLVVPVDTAVVLDLASTDVVHSWDVPALAGKRDAVPGKNGRVEFSAEKIGTYEGQSATLSGQAYAAMRTEVEVVSPEDYEAFVDQQKTEIQAAQDHVVAQLDEKETP